jgi:hypothetical protein
VRRQTVRNKRRSGTPDFSLNYLKTNWREEARHDRRSLSNALYNFLKMGGSNFIKWLFEFFVKFVGNYKKIQNFTNRIKN